MRIKGKPISEKQFAEMLALGKAEINFDIMVGDVPESVGGFGELHDYCDANEYGGLCTIELDLDNDDDLDLANRLQNELDKWIKAGRP